MTSPKFTNPKMLKPRPNDVESVPIRAGAALLCTVIAQWLYSQKNELYSEILCWMILPVLLRTRKRTGGDTIPIPNGGKTPVPSRSLWIIAIGIAATSFYKAESKKIILYVRF